MALVVFSIFCLVLGFINCDDLNAEYSRFGSNQILSINETLFPSQLATLTPLVPTVSPTNVPSIKPTTSFAPSVKYTNSWNESSAIVSLSIISSLFQVFFGNKLRKKAFFFLLFLVLLLICFRNPLIFQYLLTNCDNKFSFQIRTLHGLVLQWIPADNWQ